MHFCRLRGQNHAAIRMAGKFLAVARVIDLEELLFRIPFYTTLTTLLQ